LCINFDFLYSLKKIFLKFSIFGIFFYIK